MLFPWGVIVWLLPTIIGAIIGFGIGVGTVPSNDSNNGTILEPKSTDLFEELPLSIKFISEDTEINENENFWVYFGIGALSICIISVCTVFLVKHIKTRREREEIMSSSRVKKI